MPWQNNGEGGGNGPWNAEGDEPAADTPARKPENRPVNPWGEGPPRRPMGKPGPGRGGEFDDLIRRSQERLKSQFGGGSGGGDGGFDLGDGRWLLWAGGAILAAWVVLSSYYSVDAQSAAVVQRFGRYVETTGPGVHLKLPWPIDSVELRKVEQINIIDISSSEGANENLMLTGDQNIINLAYTVRWKIRNPENYLYELADPEKTVREVAESAMRAEISRASLNDALGPQRAQIADQVRERMQELLDSYHSGVDVRGVDIKQADPPAAVDDAFKDVSAAQQDAQQYLNRARTYAQALVAKAQGDAAAFDAVYAQYRLAPEVTRKRMYLETMERVLSKVEKTVVDAPGVAPYLPLPEVRRRGAVAPAEPAAAQR
ncbi:FtsH protease activity modulator HflK [Sandarakinorhabdus oryzae]|uniref:FtsH protease activity modulator HflK n=1 Tax=Sandarakinorhabdus oryzae TaxID=2675220 RepID=UPI0012E132A0|nr:FtsH protease activity modulator HflK [Sandarakinorhabdus oryzae]